MHNSLRWPWAVASLALLGAAVATARATYLFWLPCQGSMTRGSIFATESSKGPIPDACLAQMDAGTPFPYASNEAVFSVQGEGLTAVAMALTGLAWLVLVVGMRWRPRTMAVAVLPTLLSMGLAVSSAMAMQSGAAREDAYAANPWWLLLEVAALAALVAVALWQPEVRGWRFARLALVLGGVSAFGLTHSVADYLLMAAVNTWNWDCPPGCGYPTAVLIAVAAVVTATGALRRRRAPSRAPQEDARVAA